MKTKFIFFFTCIIFIINSHAQNQGIEWQKCLGGTNYDYAQCIQQTKDGGYIVAGIAESNDGDITGNHGSADFWIAKLDANQTIQWQVSLGGFEYDGATSIQQTSDGGYIVAGSYDIIPEFDWLIAKLDSTGTVQWQKTFGYGYLSQPSSIQQTKDGGYIVAGYSNEYSNNSNYWILKLDSSGNDKWQSFLGGSGDEQAKSIQQTKDGGYIVAGYADSNDGDVSGNHGGGDCWIVKLDTLGKIKWQKCLGGSGGEMAQSIQQTKDGGYIVAGYAESNDGDVNGNHGDHDYWIVKLDNTGSIKWQKSLGGTRSDEARSIQQTGDGGYIVAGESRSNNGDVSGHRGNMLSDYWIVKLDSIGNIQKEHSFGGTSNDGANSIHQTKDGGFIIAGYTYSNDGDVRGNKGGSDYWIVKLKPHTSSLIANFNLNALPKENKTVLLTLCCSNEMDNQFTVEKSKDGIHFTKAGLINANNKQSISNNSFTDNTPFAGNTYYRLSQTDFNGDTYYSNIVTVKIVTGIIAMQVTPNPSHNGMFTANMGAIKKNVFITVTSNAGKQVYSKQLSSAQQVNIVLNNQPKGVYYLHVNYDGGKASSKLVIE